MIKIYYNPRCNTCRNACEILEEINEPYEIVNYMTQSLPVEELKDLISKLGIRPIELIRTKEAIWQENYKDQTMSDDELIEAMHQHPKLIQRPIVVNGNKAIIGRPPVLIKEFLES